MSYKCKLRSTFIKKRGTISIGRQEEARRQASWKILGKLTPYSHILSFASKSSEIDLWPCNNILAEEGRLLLPRLVSETKLVPFSMTDLEKELLLHSKWKVLEPNPDLCSPFPLEKIGCVLVPGVAFDLSFSRLGYGKGHYDRFLKKLSCPFFGVGYKEQLLDHPITPEEHDVPLTDLFLF